VHLSKSLYTRGLQCVKSLWLKKYKSEVLTKPDAAQQAIFSTGDKVGELACTLFPKGKKIPFESTTFEEKIALTETYLKKGISNIYEATFSYQQILIMVDILHVNKDGSVEINEVKSSTEVKDVYLHDASIQFYVLNGLGIEVKKVNIIHINNQYTRGKELEVEKLFSIVDVTEEVKELQVNIPSYLNHFKSFLDKKDTEPDIDIGKHCFNPYGCDCYEYCWSEQKQIPEYSIFNISRLNIDKKFALYQEGTLQTVQIEDCSSYSLAQQIQIMSDKEQKSIINKEAIQEFLDTLTYPLYHLDFETFQQAIPEWEGISPYAQIPFQYSLHVEEKDGTIHHKEFLAKEGEDPRYELAKKLIRDIPSYVTVLAYNMGFEKGVIRRLAETYPELHVKLMKIHDNIKDLMSPFQNKHYYEPNMQGSYSIKKVLPALVPEMEKAYKELSLVHHGGEAMQTYANLVNMDEGTKQEYKKALLEYCKLDTLAMVKVLEKLKECVR
jgi:hypothetical protein